MEDSWMFFEISQLYQPYNKIVLLSLIITFFPLKAPKLSFSKLLWNLERNIQLTSLVSDSLVPFFGYRIFLFSLELFLEELKVAWQQLRGLTNKGLGTVRGGFYGLAHLYSARQMRRLGGIKGGNWGNVCVGKVALTTMCCWFFWSVLVRG